MHIVPKKYTSMHNIPKKILVKILKDPLRTSVSSLIFVVIRLCVTQQSPVYEELNQYINISFLH